MLNRLLQFLNKSDILYNIQPQVITRNRILRILQFRNIKTPIKDLYREFGVLN